MADTEMVAREGAGCLLSGAEVIVRAAAALVLVRVIKWDVEEAVTWFALASFIGCGVGFISLGDRYQCQDEEGVGRSYRVFDNTRGVVIGLALAGNMLFSHDARSCLGAVFFVSLRPGFYKDVAAGAENIATHLANHFR